MKFKLKASNKFMLGLVPFVLSACGPDMAMPQRAQEYGQQEQRVEQSVEAQSGTAFKDDQGGVGTYYCDPYYSDPYCGCPSYDPYCEGLPPPPPPPPAAPRHLTYTPFSEGSTVSVSWPAVWDATSYQLDRSLNGVWSNIYTGNQTALNVLLPSQGLYSFRVRACNDGGCSNYLTDPEMRFSRGPQRGTNLTGSQEVKDFVEALNFETPATLGAGYDHLRQEITANHCMNSAAAPRTTTEARVKEFKLNLVQTRDELSTQLSLSQNLGVSAKYGKFSGNYSGKKEILNTSTRVEETHMVVASLRDQFRVESLNNPFSLSMLSTASNLLQTGQGAQFRNQCGDAFVHSIAHGRQFFITFQLRSFNHTREEIRTQTNSLKVDIGNYVGASYDTTRRSQITQKYSSYSVQAHVISYGSSVSVTGVVSLDAALQFMRDFEAEPITGSSYPLDFKTIDYTPPAGVSNYPYYQSYKSTLNRWYSFDQQLAQRCEMFDENLYGEKGIRMSETAVAVGAAGGRNLRTACFLLKRAILENIQNCEDTTKWAQCVQPDSGACVVPGTGQSCLSYANGLPYWYTTAPFLTLSASLGSGLSSESRTVSGTACLSGPQIRDLRSGSVDCSGGGCPAVREGVTVRTTSMLRARNAFNSWNDTNKCLTAQVTIERPSWWGGTANINQTQTVNGLNPQSLSYLF